MDLSSAANQEMYSGRQSRETIDIQLAALNLKKTYLNFTTAASLYEFVTHKI